MVRKNWKNSKETLFEFSIDKQHWHTGFLGLWTQVLDTGLCTLDSGCRTLDTWLWTLDPRLRMLDAGPWTLNAEPWTVDARLWTLGSGHWTLSLTVSKQNQNPRSDSAWLYYWKFFGWKYVRTSFSRLFCRDYRFWRGYF